MFRANTKTAFFSKKALFPGLSFNCSLVLADYIPFLLWRTIFCLSIEYIKLKPLNMKSLLIKTLVVSIIFTSTITSCSKNDSLPGGGPSPTPITLNVTADHWQLVTNGVYLNLFSNIIPSDHVNKQVNVYVVSNGEDQLINQTISFMNGQLWATFTERDVKINYRGTRGPVYLNIKIVIQ